MLATEQIKEIKSWIDIQLFVLLHLQVFQVILFLPSPQHKPGFERFVVHLLGAVRGAGDDGFFQSLPGNHSRQPDQHTQGNGVGSDDPAGGLKRHFRDGQADGIGGGGWIHFIGVHDQQPARLDDGSKFPETPPGLRPPPRRAADLGVIDLTGRR